MDDNIFVNELGISSAKKYECKICKREVDDENAGCEEWYYSIEGKENYGTQENSKMAHFPSEQVEYLCNEHYRILSAENAKKFVPFGYPYFSSRLIDAAPINSF